CEAAAQRSAARARHAVRTLLHANPPVVTGASYVRRGAVSKAVRLEVSLAEQTVTSPSNRGRLWAEDCLAGDYGRGLRRQSMRLPPLRLVGGRGHGVLA